MSIDFNNLPASIKDKLPYDFTVNQTPPSNNNYLGNNRFLFFLRRCPALTHFCQRINVPSIFFGISDQANPAGIPIRRPGTSYGFDDITVGFIVDENMKNWLEIFQWIKDIGIYTTKYEVLKESDKVSDAYLWITNSAYKPILSVLFKDIYPTMLSGIDLDSSLEDTDPVLASVSFTFTYYEINTI